MGVYDNRSRRTREDDVELVIKDHSTEITRTRKSHPDKMRDAVEVSSGPYVVRIEQFRATRNAVTFDEKGTATTAAYILIGLNRPALGATWTLPKGTKEDPLFKVDDRIEDSNNNVYRITSPARWDGNMVEVNIELVG